MVPGTRQGVYISMVVGNSSGSILDYCPPHTLTAAIPPVAQRLHQIGIKLRLFYQWRK